MHQRPVRTFTVLPRLPARLQPLHALAYNLWWCWHHDAISLFRRIDPDLWERVEHSPVKLLSAVEQGRTESDFIALASYQLGPERPILLPPANLSMPAPVDPHNVYAGTGAGMFSPAVAGHLSRVYSPNLLTGRVDVIDPETFRVIDSLMAIPSPEHIVPSWDLQTLWVSGDISYRGGNADVMPIDPKTGKLGKAIDVPDSYNMYFTPDGASAIVVADSGDENRGVS